MPTHRFVIPDGGNLGAEHDCGEEGEEETLEEKEKQKDDRRRRREGGATVPLGAQTADLVKKQ